MNSKAKTVKEYLDELPEDRRPAIEALRKVVKKNLPKGFKEVMQYGMISYVVPLSKYPAGYLDDKKTPLPFASIASQKNHTALYSFSVYGDKNVHEWFVKAWEKSGKKLDMGKSCIRFKKIENIPLDVIGKLMSKMSVDDFITFYEKNRGSRKKK